MSDGFAAFAAQYFNLVDSRTSKHLLLSSLINHQPSPLQQPLLYLSPTKVFVSASLHANAIILHYMQSEGDGDDADAALAHALIHNTMVAATATEVRDEVFCQLVKQTRGCPSRLQLKRGLQLMRACLATSAPSPVLASAMAAHLQHLVAAYRSSSATVGHAATLCHDALEAIQRLGPRHAPSRLEIKLALVLAPLPRTGLALRVHATGPDREALSVPVHSWATAGEAKEAACVAVGIHDAGDADCVFLHASTDGGAAKSLLANDGGLLRQLEQLLGTGEGGDDGESGHDGRRRRQWRRPPARNGLDAVLLPLLLHEEEAHSHGHGDFYCLSSPSAESVGDHPPPPPPPPRLPPGLGLGLGRGRQSLAQRCIDAFRATGAALRRGPAWVRERVVPRGPPLPPTLPSPLAPQSPTAAAAFSPTVRVELRVAVFPFGGPPPPCLSAPSLPNSALPSPRRTGASPRTRWPTQDATCELLMRQLVPALAGGELTCCGGSDEHLRLAALVCAFEWKRHAARGLDGGSEGKEEEEAEAEEGDLRRAYFRRLDVDTPAADRKEPREAVPPVPTDEDRAAFVAARLDELLPRRLLETGTGGQHYRGRLDPDSPSLTVSTSAVPMPDPRTVCWPLPHIPGLDLDLSPGAGAGASASADFRSLLPASAAEPDAYRSFLVASVARLWLHVEGQSAAACRNDFLEGARCAFGYGTVSACPSAVEVRSTANGGVEKLGRDGTSGAGSDGGPVRALPPPSREPSTFADMEVRVSCHGITATAVPPADVRGSGFVAAAGAAVEVLLMHLDWDDVAAWGHSDRELALRYRRRSDVDVDAAGDQSGSDGDGSECDSVVFTLPDRDAPVLAEIVARYMALRRSEFVGAL